MRRLILLAAMLVASPLCWGQSTVSGTVTDAGSQTWNNGTYSFSTLAIGIAPVTGSLSASGTYTATLPSNSPAVTAAGNVWSFQVCTSFAIPVCYTSSVTVTLSVQTVNATPPAITLTAGLLVNAYADAEIANPVEGSFYWNVTTAAARVYHSGAWQNLAGAATAVNSVSGDGVLITNSVSTGAVTLTLASAAASTVFGNCTSGSATPTFCSITSAMLPTITFATIVHGANTDTGAFSTAGPWTYSANGAASTPAVSLTGAPYTGGSTTTNFPLLYFNCAGSTQPTTLSANGALIGENSCSTFTGNVLEFHENGGSSVFSVSYVGAMTLNSNITAAAGEVSANSFASKLSHIFYSSTVPAIGSGFGSSPSVTAANGTAAFTVNVGTGASATSGVITMPAATNGWICSVNDLTARATGTALNQTYETATTTTSVTITNQTISTGVPVAWAASDIIQLSCMGY